MIFDSEQMIQLKLKYEKTAIGFIPEILKFYDNPRLHNEKTILEKYFAKAPKEIQKRWLSTLISDNNGSFIGTWFEIMLFAWLDKFAKVEIEPLILFSKPDFIISAKGKKVIIEAKSILKKPDERKKSSILNYVFKILQSINRKFLIRIESYEFQGIPDYDDFKNNVIEWLDSNPDSFLDYLFEDGRIVLNSMKLDTTDSVLVMTAGESLFINPDPLRKTLKKKASQHKNLKKTGLPYVIAIYIESGDYRSDDVVIAMFGNKKITIDINTNKVLKNTIDKTGFNFFGEKIVHTSLAGILVFKTSYDENKLQRTLMADYIENPYTKNELDFSIFPIKSSFTVKSISENSYEMGWSNNS